MGVGGSGSRGAHWNPTGKEQNTDSQGLRNARPRTRHLPHPRSFLTDLSFICGLKGKTKTKATISQTLQGMWGAVGGRGKGDIQLDWVL